MIELPQAFLVRMQAQLGGEYPAFLRCYDAPGVRGLRVNGLKISPAGFQAISPWPLRPSGALEEGFILDAADTETPLGKHPYHLAGLFYLQEPSAMAPVAALGVRPGMRVLDLCAAPGGKSAAIADRLQGEGLLVSNEVTPARAKTLVYNLQRMGVKNAVVTNAQPEPLCAALAGYFDAVLVDAPCSGEGMFRKDPDAAREWSPGHVKACAARQTAILQSAQKALRPGGRLVYSTCTFSPEENEGVTDAFLQAFPHFSRLETRRLYPHQTPGEGQFFAALQKNDGEAPARLPKRPQKNARAAAKAKDALRPFADFAQGFDCAFPAPLALGDGRVFLPPELPRLPGIRMLCAGVEAGELRERRFTPAHAFYMAYGEQSRNKLCLDAAAEELTRYLRGEPLAVPGRGYAAVCVERWPLGFGVLSGGTLKNHLPKGLRI